MEIHSVTSKSGGYVFWKIMNICTKLCVNLAYILRYFTDLVTLDGSSGNEQIFWIHPLSTTISARNS